MLCILTIVSDTLGATAFAALLLAWFRDREPFAERLTPEHFHHLGNLLLAFVMLWAYMSFSQFLIIWNGNLPGEISWYLHRSAPGWKIIALALGVFQFALPFLLLLACSSKRRIQTLCAM